MDFADAPVDIVDRVQILVIVETLVCDVDSTHASPTHAAVKGDVGFLLCEHCAMWSPRVARKFTEKGFQTLRLAN